MTHSKALLRLVALGALILPMGCINGAFGGLDCSGCDVGPRFSIGPASVRLLVGDTVSIHACDASWYCASGENNGAVPANWTLDSDTAATFTTATKDTNIVSSSYSVKMRAKKPGVARIRGTKVSTGDTASTFLFVHDSSDIKAIDVSFSGLTVRAGVPYTLTMRLIDHQFREYHARPNVTTSDPTILELQSLGISYYGYGSTAQFKALKAGEVNVVITFRGLTKTLPVTVLP